MGCTDGCADPPGGGRPSGRSGLPQVSAVDRRRTVAARPRAGVSAAHFRRPALHDRRWQCRSLGAPRAVPAGCDRRRPAGCLCPRGAGLGHARLALARPRSQRLRVDAPACRPDGGPVRRPADRPPRRAVSHVAGAGGSHTARRLRTGRRRRSAPHRRGHRHAHPRLRRRGVCRRPRHRARLRACLDGRPRGAGPEGDAVGAPLA